MLSILFVTFLFAQQPPSSRASQPVLDHLNQTLEWFQHVNAVNQSSVAAQNLVIQQNIHQASQQAVCSAFDFAKAEATIVDSQGHTANPAPATGNLAQSIANTANQIAALQAQIDSTTRALRSAPIAKRKTLQSQLDALNTELSLNKDFQQTLQGLASFAGRLGAAGGAAGLSAQINELEASSSAAAPCTNPQKAEAINTTHPLQAFTPESAGILTLLTKAIAFIQARMQINSVLTETNTLIDATRSLMRPRHQVLNSLISQAGAVAKSAGAQTDTAQLTSARKQLQTITTKFKQRTDALFPLGQQIISVRATSGDLQDARNALDQQSKSTLRFLGLRLGILAVIIFIILAASKAAERAIVRYVHETKRRRQFSLFRRFLVWVALAIAIILNLFAHLGSIATVTGFITAGLAVALQNVILSVVAYFFIIGRHGFRIGDRVTVSNVTGEVIDLGIVRITLMELAGTGADIHSTGRIVVFSNSIIFQNIPLYKQAPGAEYVWHTVSTTLSYESDYETARARVSDAVESIYSQYKDVIERQHEALEQSVNMQLSAPRPDTRVRYSDSGLEVVVRYPVVISSASETDDQIVRSILDATAKEPKLKLAANGSPRIQLAT